MRDKFAKATKTANTAKAAKTAVVAMVAVFAVCTMMMFTGCGQTSASTLEDIAAANADLTKTIKQEIVAPQGMTSDVSFSGDSFDVTFKYEDAIDDDAQDILVKAFDSNSDTIKKNFESAIENLQTQTEISGITGTIHILNSGGDEIWSHVYPEQE